MRYLVVAIATLAWAVVFERSLGTGGTDHEGMARCHQSPSSCGPPCHAQQGPEPVEEWVPGTYIVCK